MNKILLSLVIAALLPGAAPAESTVTVFENVRVRTMTEAGLLERGSVLVRDGRVESITESAPEAPESARIIDGRGLTLMPGLADMHVHYWSESTGPVFLANSITTVRNLWGSTQVLVLNARAASGDIAGPHIYTSGPLMDGPEPIWGDGSMKITSAEQAVGAVESQRTTGYRAVKLYEGLTPAIYRAAVQAARDRDMQVWTHTPNGLSVEDVLALGVDSLEHFDDVANSIAQDEIADDAGYFTRWANADPNRMRQLAADSAKAGVWHSPTLAVIAKRYEYGANPEAFFASPDSAYVGPGLTGWWRGAAARMGEYTDEKRAAAANQKLLVKLLHDAGAPLLIGTDTPNPFVLPGFAIHDELAAFVEAGIPVAEVLRMATAGAAKFLREEGQWGVVATGARADLVLLAADPVQDLGTLRRPLGVMVNGHWYPRSMLDQALKTLREDVARQAAEAEADSASQ